MSELALTRRSRLSVPAVAAGALLLGALAVSAAFGAHIGALMVIGGLLGMVLYHAAFGFTAAWRVFITERRGRGLRAQMVMLAIAVLLFFPALGAGTLFGTEVRGNVSPVGVSLLFGAFLFGIGMQLGGGCASGTLFTAGGGNARMLITLLFFIVGSVIVPVLSTHSTSTRASASILFISCSSTFRLASFMVLRASAIVVSKYNPSGIIPMIAATVAVTLRRIVSWLIKWL